MNVTLKKVYIQIKVLPLVPLILADGVRHRLHNLYIDVVHVMLNYVLGIKIKGVIIIMRLVALDLKIIFVIIGLYVNVFSNN